MQSIAEFLTDQQVDEKLQQVIHSILSASKEIAFQVGMGAMSGVLGSTENENVQGETQKKLDVISNQILLDNLSKNQHVRAAASEEEDLPVSCHEKGAFLVAFDPLDGSSNIDINGQIGTIFTILPAQDNLRADAQEQFLQSGHQQLCAGYVLYAPSSILMLAINGQVHEFTLDREKSDFFKTTNNLILPPGRKEFSINMSNFYFWPGYMQTHIQSLINPELIDEPFNMRWNGAMVGDVHRVLSRGGIFLYPTDTKKPDQPAKLRLLYEAFPMALLVENAKGQACTESGRILDLTLTELHQRVPVIMGDAELVQAAIQ